MDPPTNQEGQLTAFHQESPTQPLSCDSRHNLNQSRFRLYRTSSKSLGFHEPSNAACSGP